MSEQDLLERLVGHASANGVEPGYWDIQGKWHAPTAEVIVAVLAALGLPVDADEGASAAGRRRAVEALDDHRAGRPVETIEPTIVMIEGGPLAFDLRVRRGDATGGARVEVALELGGVRRWDVVLDDVAAEVATSADGRRWAHHRIHLRSSGDEAHPADPVPMGRHALRVDTGRVRAEATLLVAPTEVHQLGPRARLWGVFAPLYALRSTPESSAVVGPSLRDLDRVAGWIDRLGGRLVGTLPLLASGSGGQLDPSPYAPVSRRFWNERYLDLDALPELVASPRARAVLERPDTRAAIVRLAAAPRFDPRAHARVVDEVLDELAVTFFAQPAPQRAAFERWVADEPLVVEYARFRAVGERQATGWRNWDPHLRAGELEGGDFHARTAARHVYAQWAMHRQLGELADRLATREQRLYLDLPVGAAADSFDTWVDPAGFGWGATVGAPPDGFFAAGQNWGFPPVHPEAARRDGHQLLFDCLRHHMRHAGMLRLDHVMGLQRLFWVPTGHPASEGVYVRYPVDEQFAAVAIESQRAGCAVVGEDLGTVPDSVRAAMDRHHVLRSYVAVFSMPSGPGAPMGEPDPHTVAAVDTHDTATFAGYLRGVDLRHRIEAGALDEMEGRIALDARARSREGLRRWLDDRGLRRDDEAGLLDGLLQELGGSAAPALLVTLDDLVGATEPQNVPGTGTEAANWVRRMDVTLDELITDPRVTDTLQAVQRRRLDSHFAAVGAGEGS